MVAVVGVTPTGSTRSPSSAFTNVVLPWLNSPDDDEVEAILFELLHELAVDTLTQALGAERDRDITEASEGADHFVSLLEECVERWLRRRRVVHAPIITRPP